MYREFQTSIDFGIRADSISKMDVTKLLCIAPTHSFEEGEKYIGRERTDMGEFRDVERVRPWGVWHFCTDKFIQGNLIEKHANYLLEVLEPAKTEIQRLMDDPANRIVISIWYVGPSGFDISSKIVIRLAELSNEISITCWENEEEDG